MVAFLSKLRLRSNSVNMNGRKKAGVDTAASLGQTATATTISEDKYTPKGSGLNGTKFFHKDNKRNFLRRVKSLTTPNSKKQIEQQEALARENGVRASVIYRLPVVINYKSSQSDEDEPTPEQTSRYTTWEDEEARAVATKEEYETLPDRYNKFIVNQDASWNSYDSESWSQETYETDDDYYIGTELQREREHLRETMTRMNCGRTEGSPSDIESESLTIYQAFDMCFGNGPSRLIPSDDSV